MMQNLMQNSHLFSVFVSIDDQMQTSLYVRPIFAELCPENGLMLIIYELLYIWANDADFDAEVSFSSYLLVF